MIQARYGWGDELVLELSLWRFWRILKTITEERQEKFREALVASAYTAWQMGASGGTFGTYLRSLGLSETEPVTKEMLKLEKERALERASNIINLDSKRKRS